MKKVMFLGNEYNVEDKFNYLAKDDNGYVYAYEFSPSYNSNSGEWYEHGGENEFLGHINCLEF